MPGSDARIENRSLLSYKMRSGRIARIEVLGMNRTEVETALEAAGLRE